MGNSSTKEQRAPAPQLHATTAAIHHHHHRHRNSPPLSPHARPGEQPPPSVGQGRGGSRPELAFVVGGVPDPDAAGLELRRETKQERDARRAERDRVAREKERVRSMRDESVDGGYLVTQGVYTGSEDFDKAVVRQLMIERRVAPFFKGLNEHSGSWTDQQLVAASRGLPIPAAGEDVPGPSASLPLASEPGSDALAIPIVPSPTSHASWSPVTSNFASSQPLPVATPPPLPSSSSPFRPRSKTVATLTSLSRHGSQADITPSEVHLSPPPQLDGRPVAAFLYRDASECPICFLYYPPYLNKTRCCDQPICSECFVQIKRPDPHPPEHADPASAAAAAGAPPRAEPDGTLVSEPAGCPFCVQPQFGITYEPPPFRSGLAYANQAQPHLMARTGSGMSTSSSVSDGSAGALSPGLGARRRTTSLSANDGSVITTDRIRPDWAHRLANAKAQAARRSAAATALHTAAYLMGTGGAGAGEGRGFAGFGRRNRLAHARAAAAADGSGAAAAAANLGSMSALMAMSDRSGRSPSRADGDGHGAEPSGEEHGGRRSRMDDLEEMMMMEAIRLSLASEEERKKKEEKEAKKEAKKKEKEGKKLEKAAKKGGMYPGSANGSALSLGKAPSADGGGPASKGKSVDRAGVSPPKAPAIVPAAASSRPEHGERLQPGDAVQAQAQAQAQTQAQAQAHANGEAYRPSHLRHVSNTSSASSFLESAPGSLRNELHGSGASFEASPDASAPDVGHGEDGNGALTPPAGAGLEPMFNFRSLAAMIGKDESWAMTEHVDGPDAKAGGALASSWGGTAQDASEKASHAQGGSAGHA